MFMLTRKQLECFGHVILSRNKDILDAEDTDNFVSLEIMTNNNDTMSFIFDF